jgi:hypothetical protein
MARPGDVCWSESADVVDYCRVAGQDTTFAVGVPSRLRSWTLWRVLSAIAVSVNIPVDSFAFQS